jgi:ABC-2 type transport system permease protein
MLILSRDKAGLAILFFMPVILIFIMTIIQDSAFHTMSQSGLPILFVDNDQDSLSFSVEKGLDGSGLCKLIKEENGVSYSATSAQQAVSEGRYLLAIVIPEGASKAIRNNVALKIEKAIGDDVGEAEMLDPVEIVVYVDPASQKAFINSVSASMRMLISEMKSKLIFETFARELAALLPEGSEPEFTNEEVLTYREEYAVQDEVGIWPNSVQHNVPAWTIFAMFFIIIPLSVSLIREKGEGSMIRLKTLPGNYFDVLSGKFVVFFVVCLIQFVLMMMVGIVILPLFGLPVLDLGNNLAAVAVVAVSNAFAATASGLLLGTVSTSHQQASIGGSVAVLIFAAIGGIWVPTYVMPEMMEELSVISPLNWGLNAFYNIFLRGAGIAEIIYDSGKLIIFGMVMVLSAYFYQKWKQD